MKEINMKNAVAFYRKSVHADKNYFCYLKLVKDSASWEGSLRKAEAEKEAARKRLEEEIGASLSPVLDALQKRCSARTISGEDILSALCNVEDMLGISKKNMDGISIEVDLNAQSFPNAYKYTPESTVFHARYKNGYWRVTNILRDTCHAPSMKYIINHTDASKAALIERFTHVS